ncbi:MAG: MaoC family dehydratase [Myxococcaceae bacterium]|nr:MaoC family dehydratase [Myxococcaceae bacterium]
MRYFEDFEVGQIGEAGPYVVSREEIVAFARQYDPQPFHLDEDAGAAMHFGGLVASGWHTAAIGHRLLVEGLLKGTASLGSPGLDELRWLKPVRPGDALMLRMEVLELLPSRSRPQQGSVRCLFELRNQHGETVMRQKGIGMFARRPEAGPRP